MHQASIAEAEKSDLCHRIEVRDETGGIVAAVHFQDAVTVRRGQEVLSEPPAMKWRQR